MSKGKFLLDRGIINHHIVGIHKPERFCMWVWMLSAASYSEQKWMAKGEEITIKRGQLFIPIRTFAREVGVSKSKAERFLRDLKTGTMIETENKTGGSLITICNYEEYQSFDHAGETQNETDSETQTGHRRDANETQTRHKRTNLTKTTKVTKVTKDIDTTQKELIPFDPDKPKPKRRKKTPPTLLTDDWIAGPEFYTAGYKAGLDDDQINFEIERMRNWSIGNDEARANWLSVFKNWISGKKSNGSRSYNGTTQQFAGKNANMQSSLDALDKAVARRGGH